MQSDLWSDRPAFVHVRPVTVAVHSCDQCVAAVTGSYNSRYKRQLASIC